MFNNIDAEYRCSKLSINISKILMLKMRTFSNIDAENCGNGNIDAKNDILPAILMPKMIV